MSRSRLRGVKLTAALGVSAIAAGLSVVGAPVATAAPAPAVPTFADGLSQAVFTKTTTAWIRQELWVESEVDSDRDGKKDLVHIDVTRVPETATDGLKVPVIMEMSPYYAGGNDTPNWAVDHEIGDPPATRAVSVDGRYKNTSPKISTSFESTWVPRGFAVVHAESVGSGKSEGCPTSGGTNESLGGKAVIDWLNGRAKAYTSTDRSAEVAADWTTGKVGMIGTSYNGTLPIGVASTGVPGLEAIVPISAISSWYDYYRANGAVRAPGGYQGEDLDVLADYVYSRADRQICRPIIDEIVAAQDRKTGDYSPFWDERNYLNNAGKIKAATLIAHGQNDWNVQTKNAVKLYEALKASGTPHQIYLHQGGHGGSPTDALLNRWFSRYLYGQQNGVEGLPKAYIVRENNVLTEYADFPAPGTAQVTLNLGAAADANTRGNLEFAKSPAGRTETIVDDASKKVAALAAATSSPNRLVYTSRTLTAPARISGTPTVTVKLSVDRPKANLTAVLLEYPATGNPKVVTRGWMDAENRNSAATTDPITPGTGYTFTWDFQPKDYQFAAGSKIGVMVLSSDNEFTVRPAAGTTLTVDPSASALSLPVVGGPGALAGALGETPPGSGYQVITAKTSAGALSLSNATGAPVTMNPVALTGADQVTAGDLNSVRITDARGTAAGWNLTGQVSDFTTEGGTILADNLGWSPTAQALQGGLPTAGEAGMLVHAGDPAAPGSGTGLAQARTLCDAPSGRSAGAADCGGGLSLGIPGNAHAGTYTAVLTLTLI